MNDGNEGHLFLALAIFACGASERGKCWLLVEVTPLGQAREFANVEREVCDLLGDREPPSLQLRLGLNDFPIRRLSSTPEAIKRLPNQVCASCLWNYLCSSPSRRQNEKGEEQCTDHDYDALLLIGRFREPRPQSLCFL